MRFQVDGEPIDQSKDAFVAIVADPCCGNNLPGGRVYQFGGKYQDGLFLDDIADDQPLSMGFRHLQGHISAGGLGITASQRFQDTHRDTFRRLPI